MTVTHDERQKYFVRKPTRDQLIRIRDLITRRRIEVDEFENAPRHHMSAADAVDYDVMLARTRVNLVHLEELYQALLLCHTMEPTEFAAWQYHNGISPQKLEERPMREPIGFRSDTGLNIQTKHENITGQTSAPN